MGAPPQAEAPAPADEELIAQAKRGVGVFLWANLVSLALGAALFALVWYAEPLTGLFAVAWRWLEGNFGWAVAAAVSPLFASLLVGYGYMRRAMLRRRKEDEAASRRAAAEAPTAGSA